MGDDLQQRCRLPLWLGLCLGLAVAMTGCKAVKVSSSQGAEEQVLRPDHFDPNHASTAFVESVQETVAEIHSPDEPPIRPEDLEEGLCRDDVYTQYLVKQYDANNSLQKKLKRYKSRRSRRRVRRSHELEGMLYARHRMNGYLVPYFGALPIVANEQVEFWMRYFQTVGKRTFLRWMVRGESLRPIVDPLLEREGMPRELFYLAMVESGFSTSAYSRARATGPWQFMAGTAKLYGLKINHWVDERKDPAKSTVAAARYLKDLYQQFGDWYLAMAAYNSGPGRVRRAIRKTKSRDFWQIAARRNLSKETRQYVPKVLGALLLAKGHANGFDVKAADQYSMPTDYIELDGPSQLTELAAEFGVTVRQLKAWNPELTRNITPPCRGCKYQLRVTAEMSKKFPAIASNLSTIKIEDVKMHKIRPGDTLSQIARRYKVRIHQIKSLNPNVSSRRLRIGKMIAIPVPGYVVLNKG